MMYIQVMWVKVFFQRSKYPIIDIDAWYLTFVSDYPQQAPENLDCGIFLLKACECIAFQEPFTFSGSDMSRIRTEMAVEMLKKTGIEDDRQ